MKTIESKNSGKTRYGKEIYDRPFVIHPNDTTTDFLKDIYKDKNWNLANDGDQRREFLSRQTPRLHYDVKHSPCVIMLGHGTKSGLFGKGGYVIDEKSAKYLKRKENVYIWCNADKYVEQHGLAGFYTGMIISEMAEAFLCGVGTDKDCVNESNQRFANAIKISLQAGRGDLNIVEEVRKSYYTEGNPVIDYNIKNLYYKGL